MALISSYAEPSSVNAESPKIFPMLSIAFSDLDNDGSPEVVSTNEAGTILAYHLDGTDIMYFPIKYPQIKVGIITHSYP